MMDKNCDVDAVNKAVGCILKYNNVIKCPKLCKIILNMGLGLENSKVVDNCAVILTKISGQRSCLTKCRKSISSFKIRKDMIMGCKVTLRRFLMYNFLKKILYVVMPMTRDFSGFSINSISSDGNFSFGLKDLSLFPEVEFNDIERQIGLDVSLVINSSSLYESYVLLKSLGFVFYDDNNDNKFLN